MAAHLERDAMTKEEQFQRACAWLDELGVREFNREELSRHFSAFHRAIEIGAGRKERSRMADGGCEALDSLITPLSADAFVQLQTDQRVVVGNFGGTNWQTTVAHFDDRQVQLGDLKQRSFTQGERRFESPPVFAGVMVDLLLQGLGEEKPELVAISLGFLQNPVWTANGLDTTIPVDDLAKYWQVNGLAGKKIGELIIAAAQKRGWQIKKIYITNDTITTAWPRSFGLVAGEGTNSCLAHPRYHQGHLLNLEAGRFPLFEETELIKKIKEWDWLPQENLAEFHSGGAFLIKQLAGVARSLTGIVDRKLYPLLLAGDSSLVSLCAAGKQGELERRLRMISLQLDSGQAEWISIDPQEFTILKEAAQRILGRAGQVIGIMVAAMVDFVGIERPEISVEGSVLLKGEGVRMTAEKTIRDLLREERRIPVLVSHSGMEGVAAYALYQNRKVSLIDKLK